MPYPNPLHQFTEWREARENPVSHTVRKIGQIQACFQLHSFILGFSMLERVLALGLSSVLDMKA